MSPKNNICLVKSYKKFIIAPKYWNGCIDWHEKKDVVKLQVLLSLQKRKAHHTGFLLLKLTCAPLCQNSVLHACTNEIKNKLKLKLSCYLKDKLQKYNIVIQYTYISITHYKSLISILSTCNYVTSSHVMSSFSIKKYFWKIKKHDMSPYVTTFVSIEE
jgi:hypothetical protein